MVNSALTQWLHQGLRRGVCPLCHVAHKAEKQYLWYFFDEYSTQDQALDELRAAHGFCLRHAAGLRRIEVDNLKSTLGISQTYEDVLSGISERLARLHPSHTLEREPCPACATRDDEVRRNARHLIAMITENDRDRDRYARSVGLCMPHFAAVWSAAGDGMIAALLAEVQRRSVDAIREALAHHIDTQRPDLKDSSSELLKDSNSELEPWQRALLITAGWPDDDLDP